MAVAIGPQIDVFTSTDYVILHQIHFVTSSADVIQQGSRTMPILPDPKSLSTAIARIARFLKWRKLAFLSQGNELSFMLLLLCQYSYIYYYMQ